MALSAAAVAQEPVVNTVFTHLAYPQPIDRLRAAYFAAITESDLRVVSDAPGRIDARPWGDDITLVTVEFGPGDTLATDVRVTYSYVMPSGRFTNHAYELPHKARRHLDTSQGYAHTYAQARMPPSSQPCLARGPDGTEGVTMARPRDGLDGIARRLRYTGEARRAGIQGRLIARFAVNERGRVTCVEITTGLPMGLNERAMEALMETEFEPATLRGQPIPMTLSLPLTFRLVD